MANKSSYVKSIQFNLNDMSLTFVFLRLTLMCNMFVLKHPEYNFKFPVHGNVSVMGGYLNFPKNIFKLIKKDLKKSNDNKISDFINLMENKADDLLKNNNFFDDIDIKDKKSFNKLYEYCIIMEFIFKKLASDYAPEGGNLLGDCFYYSADFMQKYFELMGYWTAKMEDKAKRRESGKGQKDAQEQRAKKLKEKIETFIDDFNKDIIEIDKGLFCRLLNETFEGAEEYPRHPKTVKTYKEKIEKDLNKKINLTRKK